jgi:uncharacterized protein involved in exopolysaccharide biosynthesis
MSHDMRAELRGVGPTVLGLGTTRPWARADAPGAGAALRRRWWLPTLTLVAAGAGLLGLAAMRGPTYVASGMVELRAILPSRATDEPQTSADAEPPTRAVLETHRHLLESNQVLDDALQLLGRLPENPAERPGARTALRSRLRLTTSPRTFLVKIESTASDPDEAKRIADAVMAAFVRFTDGFLGSVTQRTAVLREKEQHLAERVRLLEAERDAVTGRRRGAGGEDLAELTERWKGLEEQLAGLAERGVEEAARRARLDATVASLTSSGAVEAYLSLLEPPEERAARNRLGSLRTQLLHIERTVRPERLEGLPERAQLERELARELEVVRGLVRSAAQTALARSEGSLGELEKWTAELTARRGELEAQLAQLERDDREATLRGEALTWFGTALTETREQLHRLESASQSGGARIVDVARRPSEPSPPVGPTTALLLLLLAAGAGVGLAASWDSLVPPFVAAAELPRLGVRHLGRFSVRPFVPACAAALLAAIDERGATPRRVLVTGPVGDEVLDAVALGLAREAAAMPAPAGAETSGAVVLGRISHALVDEELPEALVVRPTTEVLGAEPTARREVVALRASDVAPAARTADAVLIVVPDAVTRERALGVLDEIRAAGGRTVGVVVIGS